MFLSFRFHLKTEQVTHNSLTVTFTVLLLFLLSSRSLFLEKYLNGPQKESRENVFLAFNWANNEELIYILKQKGFWRGKTLLVVGICRIWRAGADRWDTPWRQPIGHATADAISYGYSESSAANEWNNRTVNISRYPFLVELNSKIATWYHHLFNESSKYINTIV